jgi:tetratricopeptide (TPR) repeat protein
MPQASPRYNGRLICGVNCAITEENRMVKLHNIGDDEWVFEDALVDISVHDKLDEAMDLWHSGMPSEAEDLIKTIISRSPYHIDAYHHLSMIYEEVGLDFEAYLCCREAVRIGLSAMPEAFSWVSSKLEWGHIDNRPFLRAYHNLGLWLEKRNEIDQAIVVYGNMLSACPNDNIGVRYILPKLWMETGDLLSIVRLQKEYPDDYSPEFMYTYPLALIMLGEIEKAKTLLEDAKSAFPLVAKELKKKRHSRPKSSFAGGITVGGADQAYEYWKQYGKYWSDSEQAMSFL